MQKSQPQFERSTMIATIFSATAYLLINYSKTNPVSWILKAQQRCTVNVAKKIACLFL